MRAWTRLAGVAAVAVSAPSAAQAPDQVLQPYIQISRMLAYDTTCKVLDPVGRAGLEASLAEQGAQIPPDRLTVGRTQANLAAEAMKAAPCAGPQAAALTAHIRQVADGQAAIWLARADGVVKSEAANGWATGMTTVAPNARALAPGAARVRASNPGSANLFLQAALDADKVLALACNARRAVRSPKGPRDCPAVPAANQAMTGYAQAWLAAVEAFTQKYVQFTGATQAGAAPTASSSAASPMCVALKRVRTAWSETPRFKSITKPGGDVGSLVFPGYSICQSKGLAGEYNCYRGNMGAAEAASLKDRTRKEVEACFGTPMILDAAYSDRSLIARLTNAERPHVYLRGSESSVTVGMDLGWE